MPKSVAWHLSFLESGHVRTRKNNVRVFNVHVSGLAMGKCMSGSGSVKHAGDALIRWNSCACFYRGAQTRSGA